MRPRVAAISGFVNSESGLRIGRRIGLAGPGINRVPGQVARIDGQCPDGIGGKTAGDEFPLLGGVSVERMIRLPDTPSSCCEIKITMALAAVRCDRKRSNSTRCCVGSPAKG